MNTLFLTGEEKKLFESLSNNVKEGWEVEIETNEYEDTPEKFELRLDTYMPYDPVLRVLADELSNAKDSANALEIAMNTDFSNISEDALIDLFYTLGSDSISAMIQKMLENASKDENIHEVAAFSVIRHSLLSALITA